MKNVRLIKKQTLLQQSLEPKQGITSDTHIKRAVQVAKRWVKEQQLSQQQQARQMFTSLFARPQV